MHRRSLAAAAVAVTAATAAVTTVAQPAYADTYAQLQCIGTQIANTQVCFYRSQQNIHTFLGRFINRSSYGIYNNGYFQYSNGSVGYNCGYATTPAGGYSDCVVSFPAGQPSIRLCDTYSYAGGYPTACTNYQPS